MKNVHQKARIAWAVNSGRTLHEVARRARVSEQYVKHCVLWLTTYNKIIAALQHYSDETGISLEETVHDFPWPPEELF